MVKILIIEANCKIQMVSLVQTVKHSLLKQTTKPTWKVLFQNNLRSLVQTVKQFLSDFFPAFFLLCFDVWP
jgi:hypothetical protein